MSTTPTTPEAEPWEIGNPHLWVTTSGITHATDAIENNGGRRDHYTAHLVCGRLSYVFTGLQFKTGFYIRTQQHRRCVRCSELLALRHSVKASGN